MKTLTRVVLEQDDKPYLKGTPAQQTQRAKILKRTKKVKAERDARAARGEQASTRPGYSSVSDSIIPLVSDRIFVLEGSFQNMRRAARAGNQYAADRMMAKNLGKKAEYHVSNSNTNPNRADLAQSLIQAGKTNKTKANRLRLRSMKAEQRVDEISAEKYDSMTPNQKSAYGSKVAKRYKSMYGDKKGANKDLTTPLRALKAVKDKAYDRAGRNDELKKLRARRKMPFKKGPQTRRDPGEEAAREAGNR